MKHTFCVLVSDNGGIYTVLTPSKELGRFNKTNQSIPAGSITPFGFPFILEFSKTVIDRATVETEAQLLKEAAFQALFEALMSKIEETGADYVLIDKPDCTEKITPVTYHAQVRCQLYVEIVHRHVLAPVYR